MPEDRRSIVTSSVLVAVFFLSVYLLSGSSDLRQNGDTELRFQTTQAIVDHGGRLWISQPAYTDTRVTLGRGGHLYAFYAPGQTVLMIPLYLAGKFVAHHLSLPYDITTLYAARSLDLFLCVGLVLLFFWLALILGFSRRVSLMLTLLFGLGTAIWPDAQSALEQTPVDLFLLIGVVGIVLFVRGGYMRRRRLLLAGAGAGLALFTRYDAGIYLPVLIGYVLVVRAWRREWRAAGKDLAAYALGALPFLLFVGWWDYARFGSPFLTGLSQQTFGLVFFSGLAGLLFSPGKGLVWYVPLLFLLPWAVPAFWRRLPNVAALFALIVSVTILFYANVLFWHGDPSWGPRYLYTTLPYLVLPLGEVLRRWSRLRFSMRAVVVAVVAVSVLVQVAAVTVNPWRFWYQVEAHQEATVNADQWEGQPFRWGSTHYHYYWNVHWSPVIRQFDNAYQVIRASFGDQKYRESGKPDPYISSVTADLYPVNTVTFWWADTLHPLLGRHTRWLIAGLLAAIALASLAASLFTAFRPPGARVAPTRATVEERSLGL